MTAETTTEDPGIIISIRIPPRTLKEMDEARGDDTRSAYIRAAIERLLKRKPRA